MEPIEANELQHPKVVQPEILLSLIEERLKLLGFADRRRRQLAYDMESLYNDNIRFVSKMNSFLTTPPDNRDGVANLIADLWADLEHTKLHIRSSQRPLRRLLQHVTSAAEELDKQKS